MIKFYCNRYNFSLNPRYFRAHTHTEWDACTLCIHAFARINIKCKCKCMYKWKHKETNAASLFARARACVCVWECRTNAVIIIILKLLVNWTITNWPGHWKHNNENLWMISRHIIRLLYKPKPICPLKFYWKHNIISCIQVESHSCLFWVELIAQVK